MKITLDKIDISGNLKNLLSILKIRIELFCLLSLAMEKPIC